jgi:DNA-binding IclR family transcriptional regulator
MKSENENLMNKVQNNERVTTLERAILILDYLMETKEKPNFSQIAAALNIPNGTAFNILKTLEKYGLIERDITSKVYQLGMKLFQLGNNVESIRELREAALPFMRELTRNSRETSQLGFLFEDSLSFLEIIEGLSTTTRAGLGLKLPLHAPAAGKVLFAYQSKDMIDRLLERIDFPRFTINTIVEPEKILAELEKTREQGYAIDDEEVFMGTVCIAAPIFNHNKRVCAALGITGDANRIKTNLSSLIKAVQHGATNISIRMGFVGR